MNKFLDNKPYFALATGTLLIGLSPILIKLEDAPGMVTSFYRFIIGSIVLTAPFLISRNKITSKTKFSKKGILFATLAGFCLATDMAMWTTGIVASNATLPTLVGNLAPVWVGLGAMILFKEKQNLGFWLGLLMAIIGVGLLVAKDFMQPTGVFKGIVLGFFAGIFYAGYMLLTQPGRKHLSTLNYLFFSTLATAIFAFIYVLIFHYDLMGYDFQTWILWLLMGVGIQVFGWFLINYSQGYLPASMVSPTLLGQPVITAIIAIIFLNEKLTIWHFAGGVVIIAGIYIVHFSRSKG
jgi:drug/metabolite transporter (DMT)-like permease